MPATFSSLKYRDFRLLLFSGVFASAAQWVQQITVGWLVYQLTESPFLLGLSASLRVLPALFIGPLAGVASDRLDRRKLLIGTEGCLTVLAFSFAVTVALGYVNVWQVLVFMFLSGVGTSVNHVARHSMVPNLVPREQLMNAIALHSSLFNLTRILGPTMGGVLIATLGPASNFFLQSALYFVFFVLLIPLRVPQGHDSQPPASIASDLVEGVRYAAARKEILYQLSMAVVIHLVVMPYGSMLPAFAEEVIHVGPEGLGLLYAAVGSGAIVASLCLASLGDFRRIRWLLIVGSLLVSASLAFLGLSQVIWLSFLALILVGAGQMTFNSTNNTMLQQDLPDEYRGRVTAIYQASQALQAVGALAIGALAEVLGVGVAEVAAGVVAGTLVLGLNVLYKPGHGQATPSQRSAAAAQLGEYDT